MCPQGGVGTIGTHMFLVINTPPLQGRKSSAPGVHGVPGAGPGVGHHETFALHDDAARGDSCPGFTVRATYLPPSEM